MSGFAGIVNLDGAPVSERLAQNMAAAIAFRGPDATSAWCGRGATFTHALLRTTPEAASERQPLTLDGQVWIVGDARVDGRRDLAEALEREPAALLRAPDIELILRAYLRWGERCVEHLIGDFAFAVWDASRRRLFAARDHMGVKPLYFARLGSCVIFSNTLTCVRRHPLVSDCPNDVAIADFLLFDVNLNPSATAFADVSRLPPAHTLTAGDGGVTTARYWTVPIEEPLEYPRLRDYTDAFHSLLRTAVDDRLRGGGAGVFMSGGLDSPTLAATAHRLVRGRGDSCTVRAFAWVEDRHDEGRERRYATLAARHIGIPIDFREPDCEPVDWEWEQKPSAAPEPDASSWSGAARATYHQRAAAAGRVFLLGEGPDNLLYYEWRPYLRYLTSTARVSALVTAAARHLVTQRRVPLWNSRGVFSATADAGVRPSESSFPRWLTSEFERRANLADRWRRPPAVEHPAHPLRPRAHASLYNPLWQTLFEGYDTERTGAHFEVRYPFVDVRMIRFMLAVPAIPWCRRKYLLRRAMRHELPAPIIARDKNSPLPGQIWQVKRQLVSSPFSAASALSDYIDLDSLRALSLTETGHLDALLRVRSLNHWLHQLGTPRSLSLETGA